MAKTAVTYRVEAADIVAARHLAEKVGIDSEVAGVRMAIRETYDKHFGKGAYRKLKETLEREAAASER